MFPEPLVVQTTSHGLSIGYGSRIITQPAYFAREVEMDLTIGTDRLNATSVPITAHTDRTVDLSFGPIMTRIGRGMPFVYVETDGTAPTITFNSAPKIFAQNKNILGVTVAGTSYGMFCPTGGQWTISDKVFTCRAPSGRRYLSVALLPRASDLAEYTQSAFSFPINTTTSWSYDSQTSSISTTFVVTTEAKDGTSSNFIQALYPHQYGRLKSGQKVSDASYISARGELKTFSGKSFTTVNTFHGLLPFLPLASASRGSAEELGLIRDVAREPDAFPSQDTYSAGKRLNRLAQLLPIAAMNGDEASLDALKKKLRTEIDSWSLPEGGTRRDRVFEYEKSWGTLIGYPASYGSDTQLNDHHFHYGYWIHSAALLGLYDPTWLNSSKTSRLLDSLIRDIANTNPNDPAFPLLRHFDAYAGHSWASGQAPFADGQNEESSSEAINAWAGIALYAGETGKASLRDAAIWMYTLETDAVFDYWFNAGPVRTFPSAFERVQVSNIFDGKSDTATWFGADPEFEHGIQFLPFTGASLYLGRDADYCRRNLAEVLHARGGKLDTEGEHWPDIMEMYQAFYDPSAALKNWTQTSYTFNGESRAHQGAWLRSLEALGRVDTSVTADTPFYGSFIRRTSQKTHVAFNPQTIELSVRFSDGAVLKVPPGAIVSDSKAVESTR
jgi:endoglucanase Acf2